MKNNEFKFDQRLTANYFAPLCGLCVHRDEESESACKECFSEVSRVNVEEIEVVLEELVK